MAALFLRRLPSSRWAFQQMRLVGSVVHEPACEDFTVKNEPILGYLNGSPERQALDASLKTFAGQEVEIPIVIAGERLKTGEKRYVTCPFEHKKKLAHFYRADPFHVQKAIDSAMRARGAWEATPLKDRIDIFLKAADLCAGKYRADLNAATMLGQGKTIFQAEIDSAAELVDFLRFNAFWCKELVKQSVPLSPNPSEVRNHLRYRGLEGFIASISPFNFTAIGGNLGASPALMGNVILWKPSETALLSNWIIFQILEEAGMPPGVVNFVPAEGPFFGKVITDSQHLAAVNFTGSVATWRWIVRAVGSKIDLYTNFPRLIGETGGKNFHLIHPSADLETVVASTIRSAFEYGGQKCSACSRLYVPHSVWPKMREMMLAKMKEVKIGDARDPSVFFSAVIDKPSFNRIKGYLKYAKQQHRIIHGGKYDDSKGWYIEPTIVEVDNHKDKLLQEEIFGPVLSVHEFPDKLLEKDIFELIGKHSFGLTGAVYAQDEAYLKKALEGLKFSCGNFYINDKSTGAVVGQQPFGGSRLSGTNDKAGGIHYMLRFANPQTVKETFIPMPDVRYPYMKE